MKMTVITSSDGTIVGAMHISTRKNYSAVNGGLVAGPGQQLHEIEVPDSLAAVEEGKELQKHLDTHLKQHLAQSKKTS